MAYFGLKVHYMNYDITIKIHGPLDEFVIDTHTIKVFINKSITASADKPWNMARFANKLVDDCCELYCDGITTMWAEVEITSNTGLIYSSSAEKVLSNV